MGLALIALLSFGCIPLTSSANATLDYATQVGYFAAATHGSYTWFLDCHATQPSVKGPVAVASGTEYADGWMPGFMAKYPNWSDKGTLVEVGGQQIILDPRTEDRLSQSSTFSASGSWTSGGAGTAHVAWALWGSPATCTASVNGAPAEVRYLGGTSAYYAGPEAFTGGPFVQAGGNHAAAARVFNASLRGGALFASLELGELGQGLFSSDDPYRGELVEDCRAPNGDACEYTRPAASTLTASVVTALEVGGGYQGELWVITLPKAAQPQSNRVGFKRGTAEASR